MDLLDGGYRLQVEKVDVVDASVFLFLPLLLTRPSCLSSFFMVNAFTSLEVSENPQHYTPPLGAEQ